MSEPNRQRVNEAVSAWFEPKPLIINVPDTDSKPPRSIKGFWHIGWKYVSTHRVVNFVTPLDYFTDEAANARLRDRLLVETDTPNMLALRGEDQWMTIQRDIYHFAHRRFDDGASVSGLIREAWVRQFCKTFGIEVSHD
jgi:hypothetical protein